MRAWAFMLGGMIVWAAHFFALYIVASIFLTSTTSRVLAALITVACLVAASLALVAILWQGLPAFIA